MAYKDKDKQREANRERQRRYKARQKALPEQGVTQGVTNPGITDTKRVIPQGISDQEFTRLMTQAQPDCVQVSKPGDADYVPMCQTTRNWQGGGLGGMGGREAQRGSTIL